MYPYLKNLKIDLTLLEAMVLFSGTILQAFTDAKRPLNCVVISCLFDDTIHRVSSDTVRLLKQQLKQDNVPCPEERLELFPDRSPFALHSLNKTAGSEGMVLEVATDTVSLSVLSTVSIKTDENKSADGVSMYTLNQQETPQLPPLPLSSSSTSKVTMIKNVRTCTTQLSTPALCLPHCIYANHTHSSPVCRLCMLRALLPGALANMIPRLEPYLVPTHSEKP